MTAITYLLPISETLKTAWDKVKGAKGTVWIAFIIMIAITFGLFVLEGVIASAAPSLQPIIKIFAQIFTTLLSMGIIYIGIRRAQDLPISYSQLFHSFDGWLPLKLIGLYILQTILLILPILIMVAGVAIYSWQQTFAIGAVAVLLILTGIITLIYLAVRLMFSIAIVLDKDVGPLTAIKLSYHITQSNFWRIVAISLLISLLTLISAIPLGIGLIWTIPFSYIAFGVMYKTLLASRTN